MATVCENGSSYFRSFTHHRESAQLQEDMSPFWSRCMSLLPLWSVPLCLNWNAQYRISLSPHFLYVIFLMELSLKTHVQIVGGILVHEHYKWQSYLLWLAFLSLENVPRTSRTEFVWSWKLVHGSGVRDHTDTCQFLIRLQFSAGFVWKSVWTFPE